MHMSANTRFLILPVALLQLASAYIPNALGYPDIGTRATQDGIPPELPPGPFFAIWGIIFLAYIAFGIYALRNDTELSRTLSPPLVASGLVTALWMPSQQIIGNALLDLILLLPLIYFSWRAAFRFDQMRGLGGSPVKWVSDVLTGLLAGWASVAVSISVPRAGRELLGQGPTDSEWVAFLSVIAAVTLLAIMFKRYISQSLWFFAAAGWGLLGILLNNFLRTGYGYFGWITGAFALWLIFSRLRNGANGARRQTEHLN